MMTDCTVMMPMDHSCVTYCTDIRGTSTGLKLKRLGIIMAKMGEHPSLNKIMTKTMSDSMNLEFQSLDEFHAFMVEFNALQQKYRLPQHSAMDWCKANAEELGASKPLQLDEPERPNLMKNHKEHLCRELSANMTAPPARGHVVPPPSRGMGSTVPVYSEPPPSTMPVPRTSPTIVHPMTPTARPDLAAMGESGNPRSRTRQRTDDGDAAMGGSEVTEVSAPTANEE